MNTPLPLRCAHCGAPLPSSTEASVTCPFCKGVTRVSAGRTELRAAVRDVLAEERRQSVPNGGAPRPGGPQAVHDKSDAKVVVALVGGLAIAGILVGVLTALMTLSRSKGSAPKAMAHPAVTAPPAVSTPPPPPPPKSWGEVKAIALDERGDPLALIAAGADYLLAKADGATLAPRWIAPFRFGAFGGPDKVAIFPRGGRVALATSNEIVFFEASDGTKSGGYIYDSGGILETACVAGESQVSVYVLGGGTMHFDATTMKKATRRASCAMREVDVSCAPHESWTWRPTKGEGLDCRYQFRSGTHVLRGCETLDGTKREVVVSVDAKGKQRWQIEGEIRSFISVVDGVLVIDERERISGLDPETGTSVWTRPLPKATAAVADGKRVFYGLDGTIVAVEAKTGQEVARMVEASP